MREGIYYNIRRAQSVNNNEHFKKLNDFMWECDYLLFCQQSDIGFGKFQNWGHLPAGRQAGVSCDSCCVKSKLLVLSEVEASVFSMRRELIHFW